MATIACVARLRARGPDDSVLRKLQHLFDAAGFAGLVAEGERTAIKLHFGERGNTTYLSPVFVRTIVDRVRRCGARPFLTDTNTLYTGSRDNAADHLTTTIEHGFAYAVAGAPLIIADGLTGNRDLQNRFSPESTIREATSSGGYGPISRARSRSPMPSALVSAPPPTGSNTSDTDHARGYHRKGCEKKQGCVPRPVRGAVVA
jgi:hypothetical protein